MQIIKEIGRSTARYAPAITIVVILMVFLAACGQSQTQPAIPVTPTLAGNQAQPADPQFTPTARPSLVPAVTSTPLPTTAATQVVPSPLPTEQRNYELCVSIASDSNGYGHVTFEIPDPDTDPDPVAIIYITPIETPLRQHLHALGLTYLEVVDRSLSAGGLTIASSNYLGSDQYFWLQRDHCQFVVVTPFFPDVAVGLSRPDEYITNLEQLVRQVIDSSPSSHLLLLNYYQTDHAAFTADNAGKGLTPERIQAFNEALAAACVDPNGIGQYADQITCIDTQPFFEGMGHSYLLAETTKADFDAALFRENGYSPKVLDFFARYPDATITGDGIHLSLAGRDRLAERLAEIIFGLIAGGG